MNVCLPAFFPSLCAWVFLRMRCCSPKGKAWRGQTGRAFSCFLPVETVRVSQLHRKTSTTDPSRNHDSSSNQRRRRKRARQPLHLQAIREVRGRGALLRKLLLPPLLLQRKRGSRSRKQRNWRRRKRSRRSERTRNKRRRVFNGPI